jgi:hypothetical protein
MKFSILNRLVPRALQETPHGVYETEAISAQGTLLARAPADTPTVFTEIAELRDMTPPALSRNTIEITNHNNLDDAYIVGIRRHGDMTMTIGFLPDNATHDHLTGLQHAWFIGSRDIYKLTFPDGFQWLFSGFVTNVAPDTPVDDGLTAEVTIRPTGRHDFVSAP